MIRQRYLVRKIKQGAANKLGELRTVHCEIEQWYSREADKIKLQSRIKEYQDNEKTRIYHHEIHRNQIKKSSILKLQTENGLILGHQACADYLEQTVVDHYLSPAILDPVAQQALLAEVEPVFTEQENENFISPPLRRMYSK